MNNYAERIKTSYRSSQVTVLDRADSVPVRKDAESPPNEVPREGLLRWTASLTSTVTLTVAHFAKL